LAKDDTGEFVLCQSLIKMSRWGALASKKAVPGPPWLNYSPPHIKTHFNFEQILFMPLRGKVS
jgi:hypothetical protein